MKKIQVSIVSLLIIILLSSCMDEDQSYTVEVKDGIKYIENSSEPTDIGFKINPTLHFKLSPEDLESEDSIRFMNQVTAADLDKYGNIYLLDKTKSTVHKYSADGKYIKSFCRKGQGPGEVQLGAFLFITNDQVYIPDFMSPQVAIFDLDGNLIKSKKCENFQESPSYAKPVVGGVLDSSILLNRNTNEDGETELEKIQSVNYYDYNIDIKKKLFSKTIKFNRRDTVNPYAFSMAIAARENEVIAAREKADKFKLEKYDLDGNLVQVITKPFIPIPLTEEQKEYVIKDGERRDLNYYAEYSPAIRYLMYDKHGNIWVHIYDGQDIERGVYDVFSNEGVYLNRVMLFADEKEIKVNFVKDKLIVTDDKDGSVRIYNY